MNERLAAIGLAVLIATSTAACETATAHSGQEPASGSTAAAAVARTPSAPLALPPEIEWQSVSADVPPTSECTTGSCSLP